MRIKTIYALEISGLCNMVCDYCPYRLHQRKRGLMSWETLERIFYWVDKGLRWNRPLHLHLFGDPLLHPQFAEMARVIWQRYKTPLSFSTNGKALTPAMADKLAIVPWKYITLSPHDKEAAEKAMYSLGSRGVKLQWHGGPDHNWAGQVEHEIQWRWQCEFAMYGKMVVRWNGDIAMCCITDGPQGVIGSIWDDDLLSKENVSFELCEQCHLTRDESEAEKLVGSLVGVHAL